MNRAQNLAADLEKQLAELGVREQQAIDELQKTKEDRDATMVRIEKEMVELKKKAIDEYKSSNDFQETIEFTTSKYFGKGFDFYKRKISCLHPNLDIQDMGINVELLEEEKEEEQKDGEKGDINPLSL